MSLRQLESFNYFIYLIVNVRCVREKFEDVKRDLNILITEVFETCSGALTQD